jgi:hypothetical protein
LCQYPYKTDYKSMTNFVADLSYICHTSVIKTTYLCSKIKKQTLMDDKKVKRILFFYNLTRALVGVIFVVAIIYGLLKAYSVI